MIQQLHHRGPDDTGVWVEESVAIGHKRLSILDLSTQGHQPMISLSGRYILVFNGEVYNHASLRIEQEQRGWFFAGHSDTEVLLSFIEDIGLERTLKRTIGMFAIAVWDRRTRTLQLARDRFGEKPLYFGWHSGDFLFGSEIKALVEHPFFDREVDRGALNLLMQYGYIPSPHCIFKNTFKLKQGSILTITIPDEHDRLLSPDNCHQRIHQYWSVVDVAISGMTSPFKGTYDDAVNEVEGLLSDAISLQMQADVPLGAFLSGGIDSSLIVALMQKQLNRSVKTYSIGFANKQFNEAVFAGMVANYLETDHTEQYVSCKDALKVISLLPAMFDEPLADSSQIPTYLVANLARKDVTVSLSGDGGDEVFCGYPRYVYGNRFASMPFRRAVEHFLCYLPPRMISWLKTPALTDNSPASRIKRIYNLAVASTPRVIARQLSVHPALDLVKGTSVVPMTVFDVEYPRVLEGNYLQLSMVMDKLSYLPDDILVKVDRATMAASLESRAPFLDHRITEFVTSLPVAFLFDGHSTKRILRDILYRHVPKNLVDRPKCGFSIPLADWLRNDLHDWAMDLFSSDLCDDLLDMRYCKELYRIHNTSKDDLSRINWTILSFLSWAHEWL